MAGEYRTFKQLQKEKMTFEELKSFAKEVTEAYAKSDIAYSQTNTAKDNYLTKKGLRDVMDYAIVTNLVSRETCEQVLQKAISNQRKKTQETGSSSITHHKELIRRREEFLLNAYARAEVQKIAKDIAEHPDYPIHYFTLKNNIESDRLTKGILKRAIVENIVSDEVMEKIIERSLKGIEINRVKHKAKQYFAALKKQREENQTKSPQK